MKTIGERLHAMRKAKHISVDTIAKALGVSKTTIYRYENSSIEKIPVNAFGQLCEILGTTPAQLMGNDSPGASNHELPADFKTAQEAMEFILKTPTLAAYGGYNISTMPDETIVEFANDILQQLKLVSYKYSSKEGES